jgi:L,D-transpeptidase catalytic domain/Putative peptidoglycan binding domain
MVAAAAAVVLVLAGAVGVSYAGYSFSQRYQGRLLPGTVISGVDVSGLTPKRALRKVRTAVRPRLTRTITVSWHRRHWKVTPVQLGATSTAWDQVQAAVRASDNTSFLDKIRMRFLGRGLGFHRPVRLHYSRRGAIGFVEHIARPVELDPRNAYVDYSTGWVEVIPGHTGRKALVGKSRWSLMRALRRGSLHSRLYVRTVHPLTTAADFDRVLLLRIGENKLYLYENGHITHSWVVATGQPQYPTPQGIFHVTYKEVDPTWINPEPKTWGAGMPAKIPPGPDNPLGVRALHWSYPGVLFHGTTATYSLGYNASHGCVRLSNGDVKRLYGLVDVGAPIVSVKVGPYRPLAQDVPSTASPPEKF